MANPDKETQASIANWAETTFGPVDNPSVLVERARIELDELLEAVAEGNTAEVGRETADIIILLLRVLELHGLDFQGELNAKMAINRERKWLPKGNGTGSHIKE
jgi:NTP pyrophosphatase (non-canonical NTP hydrolase)